MKLSNGACMTCSEVKEIAPVAKLGLLQLSLVPPVDE